jgi:hypothetical protein
MQIELVIGELVPIIMRVSWEKIFDANFTESEEKEGDRVRVTYRRDEKREGDSMGKNHSSINTWVRTKTSTSTLNSFQNYILRYADKTQTIGQHILWFCLN